MTMAHPDLTEPWRTTQQWNRINECLAWNIRWKARRLEELRAFAGDLKRTMQDLDADLENLCARTCPRCADTCCRRATVWYDFKDLLFMHLSGTPLPSGQPRSGRGRICRNLTARGCRLPRIQRPFICSWYVCPAQQQILNSAAGRDARRHLSIGLAAVKEGRAGLENAFIRVLARGIRPSSKSPFYS